MSPEEVRTVIRHGSSRQVKRLRQSLFEDLEGTLNVLQAIASLSSKNSPYPVCAQTRERMVNLVGAVRRGFTRLTREQLHSFLSRFYAGGKQGRFSFFLGNAICGKPKGEIAGTKRLFRFLCDQFREDLLPDPADSRAASLQSSLLYFLWELTNFPPTHILSWSQLVEAAQAGDAEAIQLLKDVILIPAVYGFDEYEARPYASAGASGEYATLHEDISKGIWRFCIPSDAVGFFNGVIAEYSARLVSSQKPLMGLLAWFGAGSDRFQQEAHRMWDDICTRPRYGLRPGGLDRIQIAIEALRDTGYVDLQFFPESMQFPEVQARYWLIMNGVHTTLRLTLDSPLLSLGNETLFKPGDFRLVMDSLLKFIALHCYWRIVMGDGRKVSLRGRGMRNGDSVPRPHSVVRPHLRRLPVGYHPSREASTSCKDAFGTSLPSGFTFVQQHARGYEEEVERHAPIFSYTRCDLGYGK
ncbi:MAG: hypothetical protein HY460_02020 [Parcubacteria group bacterium]|nr:hypothetical protein [Parcubacteria group bacterium]